MKSFVLALVLGMISTSAFAIGNCRGWFQTDPRNPQNGRIMPVDLYNVSTQEIDGCPTHIMIDKFLVYHLDHSRPKMCIYKYATTEIGCDK